MTVKISAMPAAAALTGAELVPVVQGGANAKTTTAAIAALAAGGGGFPMTATPIATGAAPVDADPTVDLYAITSGGTGAEVLNLPLLPLTIGGSVNPTYIGARISFYLETQTDPGDSISITVDGSGTIFIYPFSSANAGSVQKTDPGGVVLDYVGAVGSFIWTSDGWNFDYSVTNGENSGGFANALNDLGPSVRANGMGLVNPANGNFWVNSGFITQSTGGVPDYPPLAPLSVAVLTGALYTPAPGGTRSTVNDALAPAFGAVVVGGGAVIVPVYYDGADWRVG